MVDVAPLQPVELLLLLQGAALDEEGTRNLGSGTSIVGTVLAGVGVGGLLGLVVEQLDAFLEVAGEDARREVVLGEPAAVVSELPHAVVCQVLGSAQLFLAAGLLIVASLEYQPQSQLPVGLIHQDDLIVHQHDQELAVLDVDLLHSAGLLVQPLELAIHLCDGLDVLHLDGYLGGYPLVKNCVAKQRLPVHQLQKPIPAYLRSLLSTVPLLVMRVNICRIVEGSSWV